MKPWNTRPNIPQEEEQLVAEWKEKKIFERSVSERPEDKPYTFYDGPPFATGLPHYGHIVASLMKDMIPRFWTMKGFRVERRWGWDCHGLPVENIVEGELGLKHKKDILKLGIKQFNEACESCVLRYTNEWKKTIARLGRWADMENDYKTMDLSYMESLWWVFRSLWDRGLIYEGRKAMHICPRCETPLSNFEVTQGYKDVEDSSVIWKFPIADEPNTFLLAWTTTPWSTPSTVGLAVGPSITYVKVRVGKEIYIFAKERLEFVLKGESHEVIESFPGTKLIGLSYEPILSHYKDIPEIAQNSNAFKVCGEDYVEVTEGTGVVTINGAYGEIDYQAAIKNGLPIVMDVEMDGKFNKLSGPYSGMGVKDAQALLLADMQKAGRVLRTESYRHSYPHCWRCDTPLLNYTTLSWFVSVTKIKDALLANNAKTSWVPGHMRDGRFGKWLEEAKDWAISRNRYWGTPLPVWRNVDDPKDLLCIGSVAELQKLSGKAVTNLHKHVVDEVEIHQNGKTYKRIPEVLDCWFESGSMPYAQYHFPFENKEKFLANFPAEFIAEGQDQTRGWFYTLHVLATALTSGERPAVPVHETTPAFRNVIVNGIVLAEDGKKMSKRLKNYPEPDLVFDKYGADSVRYYLAVSPVMKAENLNFSEKGVADVFRRTVLTLWNVVSFYKLYADETPNDAEAHSTNVLDRWVLAKLHQLVADVEKGYVSYDLNAATRPINDFVQELSTWYVRRSRSRMKGDERVVAVATLRTVLQTLSLVMAPVMPFLSELVYRAVGGAEDSVHLASWPMPNIKWKDAEVLDAVARARTVIEAGHALRASVGMKLRQPLAMCETTVDVAKELKEMIREELNVKELTHVKTLSEGLAIDATNTVGLDTTLTEELKAEGLLREAIRNINALRKKAGLTIHDTVDLQWSGSAAAGEWVEAFTEQLKIGTLSRSVTSGDSQGMTHVTEVRGMDFTMTFGF